MGRRYQETDLVTPPLPTTHPLSSRYHSSLEIFSSVHTIFLASLLTCFLFNAFRLFSLTHFPLLPLHPPYPLLSQKQTHRFSLKLSALRITIAAAQAALKGLRETCPHPAGLVWRLSRSPLFVFAPLHLLPILPERSSRGAAGL